MKDNAEETKPQKVMKKKYRVHRSNVDPDNRDLPISITVNSPSNRKVFWPGEEVELDESMVNVLKSSVEEVRINIPPESGIYESKNPVVLAKEFYPNMQPEIERASNMITMVQRIPNYIVELVA